MMTVIIIYLCLINLAAFILMGIDKRRAVEGRWRIRESVLLIAAAAGGSLGAVLGMDLFHHKTKHKKFMIGLPLILALHALLILAILLFQYL